MPIGQVRFATQDKAATISIATAADQRGKGYGTALIDSGCTRLFANTDTERIDAYIKPENEASSAVFKKAGFTKEDNVQIQGLTALHYTRTR